MPWIVSTLLHYRLLATRHAAVANVPRAPVARGNLTLGSPILSKIMEEACEDE